MINDMEVHWDCHLATGLLLLVHDHTFRGVDVLPLHVDAVTQPGAHEVPQQN